MKNNCATKENSTAQHQSQRSKVFGWLVLSLIGLSACGNKGELYLPEAEQPSEETVTE